MKAENKPVSATFRQMLEGCLMSLRVAPHWAVPLIYVREIHPLICSEYWSAAEQENRDTATGIQTPLESLIDRLNELHDRGQQTRPIGDCGLVIALWLAEFPE